MVEVERMRIDVRMWSRGDRLDVLHELIKGIDERKIPGAEIRAKAAEAVRWLR